MSTAIPLGSRTHVPSLQGLGWDTQARSPIAATPPSQRHPNPTRTALPVRMGPVPPALPQSPTPRLMQGGSGMPLKCRK